MTSTPRTRDAQWATQTALTLVEAKIEGRPAAVDVLSVDALALVLSAAAQIGAMLVESFDRPAADVIEGMRLHFLHVIDE